jgi:molybdopterin biosynthesis enzyme
VLAEKLAWFGSTLLALRRVTPNGEEIAAALREHIAHGAELLIVAGSRAMDPLDPVFDALPRVGGRIERHGVPAHPGSLLWVGRVRAPGGAREHTLVGLPSCGLFSQASVFDLLLPRVLSGENLTSDALAELGHGGLLTRDMQFRFPPYRSGARRGEVLEE